MPLSGLPFLSPYLEKWATEYEEHHTTRFAGGTVIPKASIGAIRVDCLIRIIQPRRFCSLYVDVRLVPGANPLDIREELIDLISKNDLEGEVELYLHRPGYEGVGAEGLLSQLGKAHEAIFQRR